MTDVHAAARARGDERFRLVREMFSGIAPSYERVNSVVSLGLDRPWRRRLADRLEPLEGRRVLDACCGTGDLGRLIGSRGAQVLGVDACRAMLLHGQPGPGGARIEGDAQALPVATDAVDAACVAFGLRNLVEPVRGLAEMARVVRPGGRVIVLEFGQPRQPLLASLHGFYTGRVLPFVGDLISGRPGTYRYLPDTISRWPPPDELEQMMSSVGLADIEHEALSGGIAWLHHGRVGATASTTTEEEGND